MKTLKVDIHTNLGYVPNSANKNSQELYIPPIRLAEFFRKYKITHSVVLYWDYKELEQLSKMCPEVTLYGVKWILDVERATRESMDCDLPLNYGIKLHSHRCFIQRGEEIIYGLDYGDRNLLSKALDHLPDNKIVYAHTQGTSSLASNASPRALYLLSVDYPNLKFIIGHMGAYGKGSMRPLPKFFPIVTRKKLSKEQKYYNTQVNSFIFQSMLVRDAVFIANNTKNVFLDTSIGYPIKKDVLRGCKKWAVGSDYPFTHARVEQWDQHDYDYQLRMFERFTSPEETEQSHQNAIDFIEKDLVTERKQRWYAFYSRTGSEILNLIDTLQRVPYKIVTNKSRDEVIDSMLYNRYPDKFIFIPKDPKASDYKKVIKGYLKNLDIITLHGYLRILPKSIVNRVDAVNLHPGLITKYPELKGLHPQKRTWENFSNYSEIGCVLHEVSAEVDEGNIIDSIERQACYDIYQETMLYNELQKMAISLWIKYLTEKLNINICESESAELVE